MKSILVSAILLTSLSAYAHGDRDWREDYMAYLSVEYELPFVSARNKLYTGFQVTKKSPLDMEFFKDKLEILTGVLPFEGELITDRKDNKNLDIARAFLKAEYEKIGFTVSFQPFGGGSNFIADKKGTVTPEKVLILSSHIDSVKNRGANDNGTGTIGLLTVARELAKNDYASTIRILGFDKEEIGLVGSDAYVAILPETETIIGNINFEMMGVNSRKDGAFHVIDCKKENSLFLSQAIKDSIATLSLPLSIVNACTSRSDHASFWRKKIPAIVISENFFGGDSDPCYHAKCDVMDERLDYSYMKSILTAVHDATIKLLK